ncbi:UNVERIFIED_CONTAM: hypothetical protein K2H54_012825 [Gekko kuhli]
MSTGVVSSYPDIVEVAGSLCSTLQKLGSRSEEHAIETEVVCSKCPIRFCSKGGFTGEAGLPSICNQTGSLEQEDLEVFEALVLHQLQRLLQSTMNGCLLPEEALNDKSGMLGEKQTRPELSPYFAMIWQRLDAHAKFLRKHNVLLTQEAKDMLNTFLILERNKQDGLVMPLLKENCPEECVDESSRCSSVTSCSSQTSKIKHENHAQLLGSNGAREHEVTNWSEDESKEESLLEKIPVSVDLHQISANLKVPLSNLIRIKASGSRMLNLATLFVDPGVDRGPLLIRMTPTISCGNSAIMDIL